MYFLDVKPGQIVVVQKSDSQVTLLQSPGVSTVNTTKTITLAQAQQLGFLSGTKLIPQISTPKQTIMLNKAPKTVKIVPQVYHLVMYFIFAINISIPGETTHQNSTCTPNKRCQ